MYERDDGRYGGQKDWYAGNSSAFGGGEGGRQRRDEQQQRDWSRERGGTGYSGGDRRDRSNGSGYSSRDGHGDVRREDSGGQRPQHNSSEQCGLSHKPLPYGNPRNSQVRRDTEMRERQRAEEERRAQVEHELRQIQRREEEAHAERVKQVARRKSEEEERRKAKKRVRNTWRTWLGEHDDFAKARDGMKTFARGIWRAHKGVREDVGPHLLSMLNVDIQKKIFVHLKNVSVFETFKKLEDRFLDTLLFDNTLFGRVFSSNAEEVYEFLKEKANSAGIATGLSEREFMALRLIGYANDIGWLKTLAEFIAKDAAKIEMIEQLHTISEVRSAFDKAMKRPGVMPPLWSLSANIHSNLVLFSKNMECDMKVQYPESRYAVKIVELARDKGWLQGLAKHAADKKAEEDDDGPRDMSDM